MAGILDTTFGNGGFSAFNGYTIPVNAIINDSILDSSGRTVVVGSTTGQLLIARYTSNGILDTTFGINGQGWTASSIGSEGKSLVLDSTGKIIVTGYTSDPTGTYRQLLIARYTSNGILDTNSGFGDGGQGWTATTFNTGLYSQGNSLVLDSTGKIIVTGLTREPTNTYYQLLIARYTTNGILDTTSGFGTNGQGWTATTFNTGLASQGYSLVLDSNGKIIVTGLTRDPTDTYYQLLIVRYTSNGILDTTFGNNGWTATTFNIGVPSEGKQLVLDSTGKIIVTGLTKDPTNTFTQLLVARYTSNGILDTNSGFGTNGQGWTATTFNTGVDSQGYSLVLDSTGKIIVTGYTADPKNNFNQLLIVRYTSSGILDTNSGFGTNGQGWTATTITTGVNSEGKQLVLDSTGKIIITGFTNEPTGTFKKLLIARYTSSGVIDTTFGTNGWTATTFNTDVDSWGNSLVLDSTGKIIVTGLTRNSTDSISQLLIARYTSNGILDTTSGFGTNGQGWTATTFNTDVGSASNSLVIDSNGKIIVTGYTGDPTDSISQLLIARYTSNGILDTTSGFGTNGQGWTATTFNTGLDSYVNQLVLDSNGKILVTGATRDSTNKFNQLLIARYTSNGILDTNSGFGTGGQGWIATTFNNGVDSEGSSLVLDSTGKIIVAGYTSDPTGTFRQLLVARYTSNGILDTKFGINGWTANNPVGFSGAVFVSVVLDSSGRILASGTLLNETASKPVQMVLARYSKDGILDTTFGTNGWTIEDFYPDGKSFSNYLLIDSNGKILIVGVVENPNNSYTQLLVARFLSEAPPTTEPICLPAGTPILTDQGIVPIEKLDPQNHTINHKPIVSITRAITNDKHLICFRPNSIAINCPTKQTLMTPGHEVLYKGKLVQAKHFVGRLNGVHTVPYNGRDILYNVLQREHGLMIVNNMVLETLHPENKVAKEILDKQ